MAFTRDQAYSALVSLNPAPIFLDAYRTERLPENLDRFFRPPEEFFIAPETQEFYTRNCLIPILDNGSFSLVTFFDPDCLVLVQMYVESPDESRTIFQHWQQYLADLMLRVGESVEDDSRLLRIATLIGFAHTEALFDHFARAQALSGDLWEESRRQFPLSIHA